jgi:predicted nuclease of predicted toxin-antitoxin system
VLVTKGRDFRDSYLLLNAPRQLLMVATGNITNDELLALFEVNLALIVDAFENAPFIEINQTSVTIYDAR